MEYIQGYAENVKTISKIENILIKNSILKILFQDKRMANKQKDISVQEINKNLTAQLNLLPGLTIG